MEKIEVGKIQEYPVIYVPEKKLVFCKNTVVPLQIMKDILRSDLAKHRIEQSNLTVTILSQGIVHLGCLVTTVENLKAIEKKIDGKE